MSAFIPSEHVGTMRDCPVCTDAFNKEDHSPRLMLCCLRVVCTACIEILLKKDEDSRLQCPGCGKLHTMQGGIGDLPVEEITVKLIEYSKIIKDTCLPCTDCPDENAALARCDDCNFFLCQICLDAHTRNKLTREHSLVSFEELKCRPIQRFHKNHCCPVHQYSPVKQYCKECEKPMCVSCTLTHCEETTGHTVSSIERACEDQTKIMDDLLAQVTEKSKSLSSKVEDLERKKENLRVSKCAAQVHISASFDQLYESLKQREGALRMELEAKLREDLEKLEEGLSSTNNVLSTVAHVSDFVAEMRTKADCTEVLQLYSKIRPSLDAMLESETNPCFFIRKGLTFTPTYVDLLEALSLKAGLIRTVTFLPTVESDRYNVAIEPAEIGTEPSLESVVGVTGRNGKTTDTDIRCIPGDKLFVLETSTKLSKPVTVNCPHLEFDSTYQSKDSCTSSNGVIVNYGRPSPLEDTGCRLTSPRLVLANRSFQGKGVHFWQTTLHTKVKMQTRKRCRIFETTLTNSLDDSSYNQSVGQCLALCNCGNHKQFCLRFMYNGKVLSDIPTMKNEIGTEITLHLGYLLDLTRKKFHVLDLTTGVTLQTYAGIDTSKPSWIMFYVDHPDFSEMEAKLVSGQEVEVTLELTDLLRRVCGNGIA